MRQISLSLLSTALIFVGCSRPPEPKLDEIQKEEVSLNETTNAVVAAPVPRQVTPAPVVTKKAPPVTYRKAIIAPEEPALIQEEEETVWVRDYRDSSEIKKTYNELQISDDADDFPLYDSTGGLPYNETQFSR